MRQKLRSIHLEKPNPAPLRCSTVHTKCGDNNMRLCKVQRGAAVSLATLRATEETIKMDFRWIRMNGDSYCRWRYINFLCHATGCEWMFWTCLPMNFYCWIFVQFWESRSIRITVSYIYLAEGKYILSRQRWAIVSGMGLLSRVLFPKMIRIINSSEIVCFVNIYWLSCFILKAILTKMQCRSSSFLSN